METNERKGGQVADIFQKLYHHRLRIDRNGKTILNWSSLFSLACLLLAPHMTIVGAVIALLMGYHISLESDGEEDTEFQERFRQAADTVKKTASAAARTIKTEIEKNNGNRKTGSENTASRPAEETSWAAQRSAEMAARQAAQPTVTAQPTATVQPTATAQPVNQDVVEDLEKHAYDFQHNPAARSAFSAMGSTVPTLQVEENNGDDGGPVIVDAQII